MTDGKYFYIEWLFKSGGDGWWRFGTADTLADARDTIRREMGDPATAMRDARVVQVVPRAGAFDLRDVYRWSRRRGKAVCHEA